MYQIITSNQFKKDLKLAQKRGLDLNYYCFVQGRIQICLVNNTGILEDWHDTVSYE